MARRKRLSSLQPLRRRPGGALPSLVAATLRTPLLTNLPPREQEIAAIVYLNTDMTAKALEAALSNAVGNSAIRCMLGRLVDKGVLVRRKSGKGKTLVYSPALRLHDVQERALERVAEDFFGGSLYQAAHRLVGLLEKRDPQSVRALSLQLQALTRPAAPTLSAVG
jgi:predicted transcriptional regulator